MPTSEEGLAGDTPIHDDGGFMGVDVGGTFTDIVFRLGDGELRCLKIPSNPAAPGTSTLVGIDEIGAAFGLDTLRNIHHTHSNTLALNTLIERSGAVLGMLVTKGFRDIFEIQRLAIPDPMRYDSRRPQPIIPRRLIREIPERIGASGEIVAPLDCSTVRSAAEELVEEGAQIIVVCFLHSFRNPIHEEQAKEILDREMPGLVVELSSEVWPQAREFERATLTAINAYVRPRIESYVGDLRRGLDSRGIVAEPRGARSNGGMELLASMAIRPAAALFSGPAAGVAGAAGAALDSDWTNADLMTLDVGGTSADIGVVRAGKPVLSTEEHIADFPILIPTVAVSAIGAGGGSIIWVDRAGSLKVGPRSVGSDPGPACYGGDPKAVPALTDAFLQAGLLSPEHKLGDRLALQPESAALALDRVGNEIGLSRTEVADGAIRIAIAMMAAEATGTLARRGVDAPEFRMVAYGGAGPLLGALLAEEIFIDTVLIPALPGTLSALGAARAEIEGDFMLPIYRPLSELKPEELRGPYEKLVARTSDWLKMEAGSLQILGSSMRFYVEMRYDGQGFDVPVPVDRETIEAEDLPTLARLFHEAHLREFGHSNERARIWIKEMRVHVVGHTAERKWQGIAAAGDATPSGKRKLRLRGREYEAAVHSRGELVEGSRISGPAVVEQMDTTTLIPDGWHASVHRSGAMILDRGLAS